MDVDEQAEPIDDTNSDEATVVVVAGGQQNIASSEMSSNAVDRQEQVASAICVGSRATVAISESSTGRGLVNVSQSSSGGSDEAAGVVTDDVSCEDNRVDLVMLNDDHSSSGSGTSETVITNDASSFGMEDEMIGMSAANAQVDSTAEINEHVPEQQDEQHIENAGIDPNYPLVLVRRVSWPSTNNTTNDNSSNMQGYNIQMFAADESSMHENPPNHLQEFENVEIAAAAARNAPEQQEEQQIENAGIDPNYPLVLVQRVSLPSTNNTNNDNSSGMEGDNMQMFAVDESSMDENPPNRLEEFDDVEIAAAAVSNAVGAPDSPDSPDSGDGIISMSEDDEEEAAILENPNLRDFHNQFVVIRNMIEQTRRSMAEAEANFGPSDMIPRNTLMQRFRRILFILNNRRRRLIRLGMTTPDEENPEGEANAEMEAANEDISNENEENAANDEANMTIEQEEEMNENAVRFDTNLPAEHSYLGPNMSRVSGVNYLDDHQYIKLRLFIHQHVLFPGEVLPFMVHSSTTIIEDDYDAQNGIMFGLCFPSLTSNNAANAGVNKNEQLLYGVTCQIYELGTDDRGNTLIKSRALQRFVTKVNDLTVPLEYINSHPRMKCLGFAKILPDIYLPEPLKYMNMGSMNRFRDNKSMMGSYRRFQAATTPWPVHVYETHNITTIVDKARTQLAQHKIDTMPNDPTQLSYWLVRNLHLPENMLKSVFLANTVNTRLKLIASTFKEEAIFGCRSCGTHIANCRELFAMSKHGVQSQYCNSAGYIHETNTVYQVNRQSILYSGSPSTEYSWFPGYQWHIIVCKMCEHHLGWEFKAVETNLIPKQFFGISSSSVRVRSVNERSDEQAHTQHAFYNFIRLMNGSVNSETFFH